MLGRKQIGLFRTPESALMDLLQEQRDLPGSNPGSSLGLPDDLQSWAPSRKTPR